MDNYYDDLVKSYAAFKSSKFKKGERALFCLASDKVINVVECLIMKVVMVSVDIPNPFAPLYSIYVKGEHFCVGEKLLMKYTKKKFLKNKTRFPLSRPTREEPNLDSASNTIGSSGNMKKHCENFYIPIKKLQMEKRLYIDDKIFLKYKESDVLIPKVVYLEEPQDATPGCSMEI